MFKYSKDHLCYYSGYPECPIQKVFKGNGDKAGLEWDFCLRIEHLQRVGRWYWSRGIGHAMGQYRLTFGTSYARLSTTRGDPYTEPEITPATAPISVCLSISFYQLHTYI